MDKDNIDIDDHGEYYNLGTYHRDIRTSNPAANRWFTRGLIWCYGFNHEEAATCFERAIACDPECSLAYWGLAYALGPNYNKPWEFFSVEDLRRTLGKTHALIQQAKQYLPQDGNGNHALLVERALIDALEHRYPVDRPSSEYKSWNRAYADAMEQVYAQFPHDLDIAALCADALLNLSPWKLWDLKTGKPRTGSRTMDVKVVLDRVMALPGAMEHPGILHLFVHLMEMSPMPEVAKPAADRLRSLVPDSGHLNHMPSHIDLLLGDYSLGVSANKLAIEANEKFLARAGPLNFYTLYRMHDFHFCLYAAMFAGNRTVALEAVQQMEDHISDDLLATRSMPMADWLESFSAMRVHAYIRFGMWQELIDLPLPTNQALYCYKTTLIYYGKTIGYVSIGQLDQAEDSRKKFQVARTYVPETRLLLKNKCIDILEVAAAMMEGEFLYRQGQHDAAFAALRNAMHLEANLPFDEPWGWMQPTRHAYGALLLEQGRAEEAIVAYAEDLGVLDTLPRALRHPGNVWALHGYHECLVALGRTEEAAPVQAKLNEAKAGSDVMVRASCFCRGAGKEVKL